MTKNQAITKLGTLMDSGGSKISVEAMDEIVTALGGNPRNFYKVDDSSVNVDRVILKALVKAVFGV